MMYRGCDVQSITKRAHGQVTLDYYLMAGHWKAFFAGYMCHDPGLEYRIR